jgi:hypothetical protein
MLNELDKLEKQAHVLMRHLEVNCKKIRQQKLIEHNWDLRRIDANLRIIHELRDIAEMINELWDHPDREAIIGR